MLYAENGGNIIYLIFNLKLYFDFLIRHLLEKLNYIYFLQKNAYMIVQKIRMLIFYKQIKCGLYTAPGVRISL